MNDCIKKINILYEDEYILLCEKPVGMISQYGENIESLPMKLSELRNGDYIGVVHRLDVTTGGVIAYAKQKQICAGLSESIASDQYRKEYLAVLDGRPEEYGTLRDYLYHDKIKNKSFVVKSERKGAKEAVLEYRLVQYNPEKQKSLVRVRLITGRTHQIRVQFAGRGMPICGDGKYGSRDNKCSCALWSCLCELPHPVTGKMICVTSSPMDIYPWILFSKYKIDTE